VSAVLAFDGPICCGERGLNPMVILGDKRIYTTLWLFNIAMENGSFIDDFPIKTSIYKGFSMAMLNNQMVYRKKQVEFPVDIEP